MKKVLMMLCLGAVAYPLAAQKTTTLKKTTGTAPAIIQKLSAGDSLSYAIGQQVAEYYKGQGVKNLNGEVVKKAVNDVFQNKKTALTTEQMNMCIQTNMQTFVAAKSGTERLKGKAFLASNKKRPGVVELPNGLQYEILKAGTGEKPTAQDTFKVNYKGTLIDGTEFDNSYKRGEPLQMPVGNVIQGWVQALQLMPVGSKWKIYIPSELGYGDRGAGGAIPGGATLIFEMELLDVLKARHK